MFCLCNPNIQQAADRLIKGLDSERARWKIDLANLYVEHEKIVGSCLISASFIAYTGAFSWDFRNTMLFEDWLKDIVEREIPVSVPFKIDKYLSTDVEVST